MGLLLISHSTYTSLSTNPSFKFKNHCWDAAVRQVLCLVLGYTDKERNRRGWAGSPRYTDEG